MSIESFLECIRTSATLNLQCQQIIILSPVAFIVYGLYQSSVLRKLIAMKLGHFFYSDIIGKPLPPKYITDPVQFCYFM